jgi:hypothetical protein
VYTFVLLKELIRKLRVSAKNSRRQISSVETYNVVIEHLLTNRDISEGEAAYLRSKLPAQLQDSAYILSNLGAHLGIGVVFAFDLIPLPLGTIGRVSWVAGARIYETIKRNGDRARLHSLGVFLIAAIPLFGYAAYLLPLRQNAHELCFILANHIWLSRTGISFETFLSRSSTPLRSFGRWLAPFPSINNAG